MRVLVAPDEFKGSLTALEVATAIGQSLEAADRGTDARVPCGTLPGEPTLHLTQDPRADALLGRDPLALLLGMLLDQHMRQRSS